jgi:ABC-type branched-subunit amino acid transport system ATPase component
LSYGVAYVLTGTDAAAQLTALHNLRMALEAEARAARRQLEEASHA